jgi:S1-C subfamily serine protease
MRQKYGLKWAVVTILLLVLTGCAGQNQQFNVIKNTPTPVPQATEPVSAMTTEEAAPTEVLTATQEPVESDASASAESTPQTPVVSEKATTPATEPTTEPLTEPAPSPMISPDEAEQMLADLQSTLEAIYLDVNPSVVNIQVTRKESMGDFHDFPFMEPEQPDGEEFYSYGNGSGFVWDEEGHIVTNSHVVNEVDRILVTFHDGTTVEAELVGEDPDSDLAVVRVDVAADMLKPVQVHDSNDVQVGQMAIAIGNPFGLEGTMTVGFISALGRSLPVFSAELDAYYSIPDVIQSDASINPGNSGGVLVDDQGRLIGVTSAIRSPVRASAGIGFSIPSAIVLQVVPVLIEEGAYEHPWLGVSGTTLTPDMAEEMGLDRNQRGALVIEVINDGPSDNAGLQGSDRQITIDGQQRRVGGDVIIAFDGRPVEGFDDIVAYLARYTRVGDTVTLTILRDGEEQKIDVTLGERPSSQATSETVATPAPVDEVWMGIEGRTLTPAIAEEMDLPRSQEGVLVSQVAQDSPADDAGLRGSYKNILVDGERILIGGDIITAIDGEPINSFEELEQFLAEASPGDEIELTLLREGEELTESLTLADMPE